LNFIEGILLGVLQGLTEFLPVSSSGHLVIVQSLISGFQQPGVLFDVMLHFGTLIAVILYFKKDIRDLLQSLIYNAAHLAAFSKEKSDDILIKRKWCWFIFWGTIITGAVGLTFKNQIEKVFFSPTISACMLLVTGVLLFMADQVKHPIRTEGDLNLPDTIIIGVVQGISLIPGISRSGSTIAFGLFRGLNGETSARFSFLLSIPAIIGVTLMELGNIRFLSYRECAVYLSGMTAACLTGLLAIKFLLILIRKRNLKYFSFYCWFVGLSILIHGFLP